MSGWLDLLLPFFGLWMVMTFGLYCSILTEADAKTPRRSLREPITLLRNGVTLCSWRNPLKSTRFFHLWLFWRCFLWPLEIPVMIWGRSRH